MPERGHVRFGSKADIAVHKRDVRFVPIADIALPYQRQRTAPRNRSWAQPLHPKERSCQ